MNLLPIVKTREYRNLTLLEPTTEPSKRIDSDYYVEGYATRFEPYELYEFDGVKYYERIDKNAFEGADMSDIIMQYDHQGRVLARKTNGSLIVEPNDEGLFICADLSKSDASRSLFEDIETELVTRMSWAFTVAEDSYDRETRTRTILRVKKVYDVSAVSMPANEDTLINARSYFDGVIEEEQQELLKREKKIKMLEIKLKLMGE